MKCSLYFWHTFRENLYRRVRKRREEEREGGRREKDRNSAETEKETQIERQRQKEKERDKQNCRQPSTCAYKLSNVRRMCDFSCLLR